MELNINSSSSVLISITLRMKMGKNSCKMHESMRDGGKGDELFSLYIRTVCFIFIIKLFAWKTKLEMKGICVRRNIVK